MKERDSTSNALAKIFEAHAHSAAVEALRLHAQVDAGVMLPLLEAAASAYVHKHYSEIVGEWRRASGGHSIDAHVHHELVDFLHINLTLSATAPDREVPFEVLEPFFTPARVEAAVTRCPILRERLAKKVMKIVYDLAHRIARQYGLSHLAADLAQEAFVDLYALGGPRSTAPGRSAHKLRSWDPLQGKSLRNYVCLVCMRFMRKSIRRRLSVPEQPDDVDVGDTVHLFRVAPQINDSIDLKTVMESFTDEDRRLIELVLLGYTSKEICSELGSPSDNAVNIRKNRLRKKLRELFPGLAFGFRSRARGVGGAKKKN